MTKDELETNLKATIAELRDATDTLTDLAREMARTDFIYRKVSAETFLIAEGKTVKDRESTVDVMCGEHRNAAHTAKALSEAQKEKVRALMAELTAYQTMAGLMKEEMRMAGQYE